MENKQVDAERDDWNPSRETKLSGAYGNSRILIFPLQLTTSRIGNLTLLIQIYFLRTSSAGGGGGGVVVVVVVVVFTLKTVLTSIQYPSLSYSSRQRNEFPWSHANPK